LKLCDKPQFASSLAKIVSLAENEVDGNENFFTGQTIISSDNVVAADELPILELDHVLGNNHHLVEHSIVGRCEWVEVWQEPVAVTTDLKRFIEA